MSQTMVSLGHCCSVCASLEHVESRALGDRAKATPAKATIPTRAPEIADNLPPIVGLIDTNSRDGNNHDGSNRIRGASHYTDNGCSHSTSNVPQPRSKRSLFRGRALSASQR